MIELLERAMCFYEVIHLNKITVSNIQPGDWVKWEKRWYRVRANDGTLATNRGKRLDINGKTFNDGEFKHLAFSWFRTQLLITVIVSSAASAFMSWLFAHH